MCDDNKRLIFEVDSCGQQVQELQANNGHCLEKDVRFLLSSFCHKICYSLLFCMAVSFVVRMSNRSIVQILFEIEYKLL